MPKVSTIIDEFTGGEWSPLMHGRVKLPKYNTALALCKNYVPTVQGPVIERPGTMFAAPAKNKDKYVRLVPFEFNVEQAYMLEYGDQYVRFFKNHGAIVESAKTITGITQASPAVVTSNGHGFSNGDEVFIDAVVGMTEVNGKRFITANVAANTFELVGIDSTGFTAYDFGGTAERIYELGSASVPYLEADLQNLAFAQSADVLYIAHKGYIPRKLSRTADTDWTMETIDFIDGPYLPTNKVTTNTFTASGVSGTVTITSVDDTFVSTDVGRLMRVYNGTDWGWAEITVFTSTTLVTVEIAVGINFPAGATDQWRLGLWSETTGYPADVTFFEDRLFYGGGVEQPQRIDGSRTGEYETFSPIETEGTVSASNAISLTLGANDVNAVQWLVDGDRGLVAGTTGGEWIITPSSLGEALTPANATAVRKRTEGSASPYALRVGNATLFIQRQGRQVRELAYIFEQDGFSAPDLTLIADHLTISGINQIAYQATPHPIVWAALGNGELLGMTYGREEDVIAWHRHDLGGTSDAQGTIAQVQSIATIPGPDGNKDELWVSVKRWINGEEVRYIEYMTKFWERGDVLTDSFFVDSGLAYAGVPTTIITGLDHLEGETLDVLVNGATHPQVTVSDGAIELNREATVAAVGYGYNADGQTLRLIGGAADGTAQGKLGRINRVVFRMVDSLGLEYGPDAGTLDELQTRSAGDNMDQPPPLFTGDTEELPFPDDTNQLRQVFFRQSQPLPSTIVAIMPQMVVQD